MRLLIAAASGALAYQAVQPSADELARRGAAAHALDRLRAVQSLKLEGSVVTPPVDEGGAPQAKKAQRVPPMPATFYVKRPAQARMELRAGSSMIVEVVGPDAAKGSPGGNLEVIVRAIVTVLPDILRPLGPDGAALHPSGMEDVTGRRAHRIEARRAGAPAAQVFLDAATFLRLKQTDLIEGIDLDAYYGDYRPVDGVPLPHSIEYKALGDQTILAATLDRIVLDPKLDDSLFRAPKR